MKNIISLIFILITYLVIAQETENTNSIKVYYEYSTLNNDINFEVPLIINDTVSQFTFLREKKSIQTDKYTVTVPYYKYVNNYYYSKDSITELRTLNKGALVNSKWKANYNWKITDETKIVNGYKVKKATTTSIELDKSNNYYYGNVIAWFCPDLPIPSGPARYYGLPGLILELTYENFPDKYIVKRIDFENTDEVKSINKGFSIKREDILDFNFDEKQVKK